MTIRRTSESSTRSAVALALLAMALGGCQRGGDDAAKIVKLAFVTNNTSEFWKIATNGIRKYEREAGVQVDVKMPSGKTEEQNQILENLVSQGYHAIAVSVIAPKDQVSVLNRVAGQTRLITFDSDAPDSKRLLYIGTINYEAGRTLGERIVKLLPKGGKMAVFVGFLSADNAAQRLKGVEDAVTPHGIEVVEKREDQTDRAKARSNVEDILNARSDLDLVCGLWSYNGPAIAAALEGAGKQGKVLAAVFDEEDGSLKGIRAGTISATVVQRPFEMGYRSAKWMHLLATDLEKARATLPPGAIEDTGVEVIDQGNLDDFEKRLAEWKK